MRICVMVEGQEGVSWEQWLAIARACEEAGLEGLFRSDHYMSFGHPKEREVHDAWASLTALAAVTRRIKLGTLVSPATFRHPSNLAKAVVTADHVSGGRIELGLGAGWNEAEHKAYGFPFHTMGERMAIFAEQAEIIHRSWNPGPFTFRGKHYTVEDLEALPKPFHQPHPNFIVGGQGGPKSVAVAARWADEYNTNFANAEQCAQRRAAVVEACERTGRPTLTFSLMTGCIVGSNEKDLHTRALRLMTMRGMDGDPGEWLGTLPDVIIAGDLDRAAERLDALGKAGVERVMMQMQDHADVEMIHVLGELARQVG
jgi:F420-dependent oxidoreductase-like protein